MSERLRARAFSPVDGSSLAVFRIAFGALMLAEVVRYFVHGWIGDYYVYPPFHFKYYGFEWVSAWPGAGMYSHFAVLGVLAAMIAAGVFYRAASILFFVGFTYIFLLDQARYLNHFYLVILVSLLMCFMPANRLWSVDAWLRPHQRSRVVPQWTIWVLIAQMEIVLIYAGIVKINPDWLRLQPLEQWLAQRDDLPLLGPWITQTWAAALGAYGAILLHLVGAPLLLWKRTRLVVFSAYVVFHVVNSIVFHIGIFPWLTIAATLLFFDPDWPRTVWQRMRASWRAQAPHAAAAVGRLEELERSPASASGTRVVFVLLGLFFLIQISFPVRHWIYPGDVAWNEEGHRFSWRMKLRSKKGTALFNVKDSATGRVWQVGSEYLTAQQASEMTCRPDMLLQYAHHIARVWRDRWDVANLEVRAEVWCSLNGRRPALLIDPDRDLTRVVRDLRHADWILPLTEPLPARSGRMR